MKRKILVIGLTLLLALALTVPALAGGWAVITLDELPGQVSANYPLEIGFMVRQHGVTPMEGLVPVIRADLAGSTKSVRFLAHEEGAVGHYVAELTLPESGEWDWSIEAFTVNQAMPALTVVAAAPLAKGPIKVAPISLPLIVGGLGLLGVMGGLLALRRKVRWATALVLIGLLISGVGFASAAGQPKAEPETQQVLPASAESQVELGRDLFIAKGCLMCHSHVETNQLREFGVDIGTNLTSYTSSPEYLRLWLKDPSAVKTETKMPKLELSDLEIEALIAFINDN